MQLQDCSCARLYVLYRVVCNKIPLLRMFKLGPGMSEFIYTYTSTCILVAVFISDFRIPHPLAPEVSKDNIFSPTVLTR